MLTGEIQIISWGTSKETSHQSGAKPTGSGRSMKMTKGERMLLSGVLRAGWSVRMLAFPKFVVSECLFQY